jgi:phosphatidylinositol kinase/protein kinase (PI-3  family)
MIEITPALLELLQVTGTHEFNHEQRLIISMLQVSVQDVAIYNERPSEKNRNRMENACAFFDHDGDEPFSFIWCMKVLEADPERFKKSLAVFVRQKKRYGRKKDL